VSEVGQSIKAFDPPDDAVQEAEAAVATLDKSLGV